jgi:O-antigen/teichoic acid export membrane protein
LNNFNDAGTLFLDSKIDNFFIVAFLDPISVGVYAFYNRLNEMTSNWLPVRLFENVVMPLFFSMTPADAARKTPQYFSLLLNLNLLVQWPLLAFSVAYHQELVQVVFGGKFIEYSWLLPLVFAFATVNSAAVPATLVAQYEEKAGAILLSKVFAFYNVGAMMVLIPLGGLYGAAIASGSAQAMKNLFIWWKVRRSAVWTNAWSSTLTSMALWGAVVGLCYAAKSMFGLSPLLNLVIGVLLFAPASLLFLRSPALSADDRTILASVFRGKEAVMMQHIGLLKRVAPLQQTP